MIRNENQFNYLLSKASPELIFLLQLIFDLEESRLNLNDLDEQHLLNLISEHRLEITVSEKCKASNQVSNEFKQKLNSLAQEKQVQALLHTGELFRLTSLFQNNKIEVVSLKGPLLSYHLTGDFTKRSCRDLDLLIHSDALEPVKKLLLNEGFEVFGADFYTAKQQKALISSMHHLNFSDRKQTLLIEVHWKLAASNFIPRSFEMALWNNLRQERINQQEIYSLNPVDEFIYLCIHGLRHLWFRLFWLYDVYTILKQQEEDFLHQVFLRAEQVDLKKYLLQSLDVLNRIAGFELSAAIRTEIQRDVSIAQFSELCLKGITTDLKKRSAFAEFRIHYRAIRLLDGWKAVFRELRLRRIKALNWKFFAFPDRVFFLNVVFSRTIWIIRKLIRKS